MPGDEVSVSSAMRRRRLSHQKDLPSCAKYTSTRPSISRCCCTVPGVPIHVTTSVPMAYLTMGFTSSPSEPGARYVVRTGGGIGGLPCRGRSGAGPGFRRFIGARGRGVFHRSSIFYLGGVFRWGGIFRWGGVFRIRRGARAIRWEQRGDVPRKAIRPVVPTHPVVSRM